MKAIVRWPKSSCDWLELASRDRWDRSALCVQIIFDVDARHLDGRLVALLQGQTAAFQDMWLGLSIRLKLIGPARIHLFKI